MVVQYALRGLEYLHFKRKIHRDIKAGNILLNLDGHAKLGELSLTAGIPASLFLLEVERNVKQLNNACIII